MHKVCVCVGGECLGPINFRELFLKNFGTKHAPYVNTPKTTIYQQKERSKKKVLFQNSGQKNNFRFAKSYVTKFEKSFSRRNFSIKFGSKLKNVNSFIFLKIELKKNIMFKNGDQTSFVTLRNNVHLC